MFRDDNQASRAIATLLFSLPALRTFWTATGPTPAALELLEHDGGPLSSGERVLLLAAFALWNGDRKLALADVVEHLDGEPVETMCSLIVAMKRGAAAVDEWITEHATRPRSVH